jgi:hypothetical protein
MFMIELRPRGQALARTLLMGRSFNGCNDLGGFVTIRLTGSGLGEITMCHIAESPPFRNWRAAIVAARL